MSVLISKSPRLPEDLAIAESLTGKVQTLSTASLSNWQWRAANLISAYDVENAEAIVLAQSTGTQRPQLSQCLAMVENESAGRNIFGEEGTACPNGMVATSTSLVMSSIVTVATQEIHRTV
jgi:hypothetical protein